MEAAEDCREAEGDREAEGGVIDTVQHPPPRESSKGSRSAFSQMARRGRGGPRSLPLPSPPSSSFSSLLI